MTDKLTYKNSTKLFSTENEFKKWLEEIKNITLDLEYRELGDYQTPLSLVSKVYDIVKSKDVVVKNIIEPTCGKGNFIIEALKRGVSQNIIGIEKQEAYITNLKKELITNKLLDNIIEITLCSADFFNFNLEEYIEDNTLVIGNPPWITNSELSILKSDNTPEKSNFKNVKGLDAITGKANFDIAEFILIDIINKMSKVRFGTIAFLVKNTVVRNILKHVKEASWNITTFDVYNIDAKKEFNVSTDASLLFLRFGEPDKNKISQANEYSIYEPNILIKKFGWVGNNFVSDVEKYKKGKVIESKITNNSLVWRSGVKHDASQVMELEFKKNISIAKDGTKFSIDNPFVFPLYKSSDISKVTRDYFPRKSVIVTQRKVGAATDIICKESNTIWNYLNEHKDKLNGRKSSIYKGKPKFSIFGIGEYSFKKYKIAISGMYKIPKFSLLLPINDKPVMVDDTVYFLGTDDYTKALILFALLNSHLVVSLLESIAFKDNKRPYSKDVLMRIDILKVADNITLYEINSVLKNNKYDEISETEFKDFFKIVTSL